MATVVPIGEPTNDAERKAIAALRDHLPANYLILHNFEIKRANELFEIDVAILAPHAVYLVDTKGTRGLIDVYGSKWYPEGRQPYMSPLAKLRGHARAIKGIITSSQPGRQDLEGIYVDAAVLLVADNAVLVDPTGRDGPSVTNLKNAVSFFTNSARIPAKFSKNISALHNMVIRGIQGSAKARSTPLRLGSWEATERLGGTEAYTEYRAVNIFAGSRAGTVLLRLYQADPYLPQEERDAQRRFISNAYQALSRMPGHPCIAGARDFFATEGEDRYALVTEDVPGQALRLHLQKPNLALTLDQKFRVAQDILEGIAHTHKHQVVHRNLSPGTILLGQDGRVKITGFDFARAGLNQSSTIAHEIASELDKCYLAPEVAIDPAAASSASDVFSIGLILYELFTGDRAIDSPSDILPTGVPFPVKATDRCPDLPNGFDDWLQSMCSVAPQNRPPAESLAEQLSVLLKQPLPIKDTGESPEKLPTIETDYGSLPQGSLLTHKYVIEKRLGRPGAFGVAYKVIDTLGDISRVIKVILRDRHSTLERLKKEYRTLLRIPPHDNVVKVVDADFIQDGPPFIVFEFIDGLDVGEMVESSLFAPEDALELGRQVSAGLHHLHKHGVYHCDIKPRNLLWTEQGVRIIDFNVSVLSTVTNGNGGGSRRYLPPDLDLANTPRPSDLIDRDLYGFGLTLYEAIAGRYPWATPVPPPNLPATDLREMSGLSDLAPDFVELVLKLISPNRSDRFSSSEEVYNAFQKLKQARVRKAPDFDVSTSWSVIGLTKLTDLPPNTNPYVDHLLSFYSQSEVTNAGTRGLDSLGEQTYVETALDSELLPSVLAGEFSLVIITGNAGDGKTAFLQRLESKALDAGAQIDRSLPNGVRFILHGRRFLTNHDGSQDEGGIENEEVLSTFFKAWSGKDPQSWKAEGVQLIAINEGRLIDFLTGKAEFQALEQVVRNGLSTGAIQHGIAVVNLNLRSVVSSPKGLNDSIIERLMRRLTHEKFWDPCTACDIRSRCYAYHNAQTFQDATAGPHVIERLKTLFTLTHLRGRLHITLRDLRSALAYMLVGTRNCDAIHQLYKDGDRNDIIQSYYFNSWMGGDRSTNDRLLTLLKEVDVGPGSDPQGDRNSYFLSPADDRNLFSFAQRGNYDTEVLRSIFEGLPKELSLRRNRQHVNLHRAYVALARRKSFFERRDGAWLTMLPYRSGERMLSIISGESSVDFALQEVVQAINKAEGLSDPERLAGYLALEVRNVSDGSIKSYRLFSANNLALAVHDVARHARFVEHMPDSFVLRYSDDKSNPAELLINLDVFEMLYRLNEGYRPSVEEEQGYYLGLTVFKNILSSAPYKNVLLTITGHDFYKIERFDDGRLDMRRLEEISR